jgi:lysophospholipase L1-like esterase
MTSRIEELCERLRRDDDESIYEVLLEHFEPEAAARPFLHRWRAGLRLEADAMSTAMRDELIGLANGFQRRWREHVFGRLRDEVPDRPIVVCEGDSWVAHPFIDDIADHLMGSYDAFHVLGVGAAADLLARMDSTPEYPSLVTAHAASAVLLSAGGNDLLDVFPRFLRRHVPGTDPQRLLTEAIDAEMATLMATMRTFLGRAGGSVPVLVHGYDYLCARDRPGKGGTLGRFFDDTAIMDRAERHAVLHLIVDRYNEHLERTAAAIEGVHYVDLRGTVSHGDAACDGWHDDIHPTSDGFARIAARIGQALLEHLPKPGAPTSI